MERSQIRRLTAISAIAVGAFAVPLLSDSGWPLSLLPIPYNSGAKGPAAFNTIEAGIWMFMACAWLIKSSRCIGKKRKILRVAAVTFLIFGISDLIEVKTGAWFKPLGLLLLKSACVISLLGCAVLYVKSNRSE
ncbi:hypothetical protein ACFL1X_12020 [Candidatus Hydrogenedentota bacterium]